MNIFKAPFRVLLFFPDGDMRCGSADTRVRRCAFDTGKPHIAAFKNKKMLKPFFARRILIFLFCVREYRVLFRRSLRLCIVVRDFCKCFRALLGEGENVRGALRSLKPRVL